MMFNLKNITEDAISTHDDFCKMKFYFVVDDAQAAVIKKEDFALLDIAHGFNKLLDKYDVLTGNINTTDVEIIEADNKVVINLKLINGLQSKELIRAAIVEDISKP